MSILQIEVDDELLEKLEKLRPESSLRRSEFISMAIRKALWELEEKETAAAYARQPDSEDDAYIDPESWSDEEWMRAAARNPVFQDLEAPEEDIYSLEDGEPFRDQT